MRSVAASHWRKRVSQTIELEVDDPDAPEITFVELGDAHFRTDSAVVLPEGEAPNAKGKHQALASVGLIAQALRFNEEHPGRSLVVAGHTDTAAGDDLNDELSRLRARVALAVLVGDRDTFRVLANQRHKPADVNQILSWVAQAFDVLATPARPNPFNCAPQVISNEVDSVKVRAFQSDFNRNKLAMGSPAGDLEVDGSVGELTWGAFFDCYEFALLQELGESAAELSALRGKLTFVDDERRALGFGERFPIEELGVDEFRSQTNRRVEIIFFESGEEPDLAAAEDDPETSVLYLPGHYERNGLPAMSSALRNFRIRLLENGNPIKEQRFELRVAGETVFSGSSSPSGFIAAHVPDGTTEVELLLGGGGSLTLPVQTLEAADTILGAQRRLTHLAYFAGEIDGNFSDELQDSLFTFQRANALPATGQLDAPTAAGLGALYGS